MTFTFATWQAATSCTGSARPGARALLDWFLSEYPGVARSGGIYNCRPVRGTTTTFSVHSEGRAVDVMMPVVNSRGNPAGHAAIARLAPHGRALGIQTIIFDRRIWSARSPAGRAYTGVNPHYDHLHLELTREAATTLTLGRIRLLAGTTVTTLQLGSRTLRLETPYMRGDDVKFVQGKVGTTQDGVFGPGTHSKVAAWQQTQGLLADGVVGPLTWRLLLA